MMQALGGRLSNGVIRSAEVWSPAMHVSTREGFRRLTLGDTGFVGAGAAATRTAPSLTEPTGSLARIAALVALDAPPTAYRAAVEAARRTGAREEDLLALLASLVDVVGSARVISAAPRIALAAGYDVEAALE
jgi:alkylhydroperoxidase/carboxymuconolactone decarboxylase family protein YurZ